MAGSNTYNGMEQHSDDGWRKSSSQHVCRPVIIDAEGRKQPIIRYNGTTPTPHNNAENYVVKTETYVERVQSPTDYTRHHRSSPAMVVSLPPEDPYKFNQHHRQTVHGTVHNRPQEVEEFITKVQTEVYKPTQTSPYSTPYSPPTGYTTTTTGYGDYTDNNGGHNGYFHRDEPNRAGYWATPPSEEKKRVSTTQVITKPTSDINTAIQYLKETATQPRFTIGVPPRRSEYPMETISSTEAKRRYGRPIEGTMTE